MVLQFRELRRSGPVLHVQGRFMYRTKIQFEYQHVYVTARKGNWSGTARTTVDGCTASHRINYRKNRVRMSVPRRCFSSPRWIRFNAMSLTLDSITDPSYWYADTIHSVFEEPGTPDVEGFTPRIYSS